jgi:hypothetical protein
MSYKVDFSKSAQPKPKKRKSGEVEFFYYITGDGTRAEANVQPDYFSKGKIEFIGRKGHYDHFLCSFPNELPTLFIGKLY